MTKNDPPKIDTRTFSDLLRILKKMVPHYTPEWAVSDEKDPGAALLKIFCHITENVIQRFNRVPSKNFVAFLDMLGIKLLPAQPARVPLTFKLAEGTKKEVLIPARTQAAADKTEEHEELPFETEKNLLAIPSQLKKVISVDPDKDAVYLPPPDLLKGESQRQSRLAYSIFSSPAAGAGNFQLDHVTDLEEGNFLKIINEDHAEYVIIAGISGNIVSITDSLLHSYPVNTPVQKLTAFTLFEGKNMQEHSLYIGHKDLFNIKSTARFNLDIIHLADAAGGIRPLKVSWEYWGGAEGTEGEGWQQFDFTDKTNGFSKKGEIELIKMSEGEIREKEINGVKSRWIRCILEEPLAVDVTRKLPVLDRITFTVKSSGKNLSPDQAFNNDIPLDITQSFHPLGKEPRIFDVFSIAGKEIFSKKGADITLDIDIEPRGILGAPCAIAFIPYGHEIEKIKIFTRGTYGRLMEVEVDPTGSEKPLWTDHGVPSGTKVSSDSTPDAINYSPSYRAITTASIPGFENISVFASAENGHLVERFYNGSQWQWIDHGPPGKGIDVDSIPFAVCEEEGDWLSIFVTGSDASLYEFNRKLNTTAGSWYEHSKPDGTGIDSSPYGKSYVPGEEIRIKVFVKGQDGRLYELDCRAGDNTDDQWNTDHGLPGSSTSIDSRPFAHVYYHYDSGGPLDAFYAKVFAKGSDGALWEFDTLDKVWKDLGTPSGTSVASTPHGYVLEKGGTFETIRIFVRGSDDDLWEWETDTGWTPHNSPANSKLRLSPFVHKSNQDLRIFSVASRNSIIERVTDTTEIWNEYKDPNETALTPALSWEYWNNKGWLVLKGIKDETADLLKSGKIRFVLPKDIEETEIAGQKNYWIRARIVGGDYGKESFTLSRKLTPLRTTGNETQTQQLISTKNTIRPPVINSLTISYVFESKQSPQQCHTCNNLEYLDQSEACRSKDKQFSPFVPLEDKNKSLYLGFEKSFEGGPVKIFFAAGELPFTDDKKPKLEWTCSKKNNWEALSHLDGTEALIKADNLELIGPSDFSACSRFGDYRYWLKGSLHEGEYEKSPVLDGIYPNTTWAFQAETIKQEILGTSDGEPDQTFSFLKFPVFKQEEIRVREMLSEEEKKSLTTLLGDNAVYEIKDEKGNVTETWILWSEVPDFFDSTAKSRHYLLDRATGDLQFGDGTCGMIPPADDDTIKAFSYQTGGGAQGNVKAGEIKTLKSAVASVDKVFNPAAADGGADTATLDQMLEIGPAVISHRNRAVTTEDFEWLARQASRKVVKVRCLPNTNNKKRTEIGWVTVIIVPDSKEPEPFPSLELRRKVRRYLEAHAASTLSSAEHIHVAGPGYTEIGVSADVYVTSIDVASEVEHEVRTKLKRFFHPLTGGPREMGWEFGRNVSASDIYALIEDIENIDHVEKLKLTSNETTVEDIVDIKKDYLVANGTHTINTKLIHEG